MLPQAADSSRGPEREAPGRPQVASRVVVFGRGDATVEGLVRSVVARIPGW